MSKQINALVVGVGGFGLNHARILSQLNHKNAPQGPRIDKLLVSRTDIDRARRVAEMLEHDRNLSARRVVPVKIDSVSRLVDILQAFQPQFIAICARDKKSGDNIHAEYTGRAISYGAILCEKPFSEAAGDSASLKIFESIRKHENAGWFGLELPMAVVARDMQQNEYFQNLLADAKQIKLFWAADVLRQSILINDLALHPWSLVHPFFHIDLSKVEVSGKQARIHLQLKHRQSGKRAAGSITLKNGGRFRAMEIDDQPIIFQSLTDQVRLIRPDRAIKKPEQIKTDQIKGKVLLKLDNPLQQNIIAVMQHRPLVDIKQTYESQLFLEILHGYRPESG
jgi:hypothetical protein